MKQPACGRPAASMGYVFISHIKIVTHKDRKVNETAGFSPLLQLDFTIKLMITFGMGV